MITHRRDPALGALLDLGGQVLVVDPEGNHRVKFTLTRVPVTPEKPHGLDYSLTLHGPKGEGLVGFDNAHPAGGGSGVRRKTMHTGCGESGTASIATRQLCLLISGLPWM